MELNRRTFFKIMGTVGASVASIKKIAHAKESKPSNGQVGCLIDITRCIGCRKCELACNAANKLPHQDFDDMSVLDKQRRPDYTRYTVINEVHSTELDEDNHPIHITVKEQCRHCLHPSCASACVVGALSKQENGAVTYDETKCIGCRYCMVACPFQIPAYEDHEPVTPRVMKCTFCYDRLKEGKMPACATICPAQAITFGKRSAILELAKKRLRENPGRYFNHVYGEKEVGGTSWMYISPVPFTFFPELGEDPPPRLTEMIQSGVFGYAAAPTALFAVLGGIAWINYRKERSAINGKSEAKGGDK